MAKKNVVIIPIVFDEKEEMHVIQVRHKYAKGIGPVLAFNDKKEDKNFNISFPGGEIDSTKKNIQERLAHAAAREFGEETGLAVREEDMVNITSILPNALKVGTHPCTHSTSAYFAVKLKGPLDAIKKMLGEDQGNKWQKSEVDSIDLYSVANCKAKEGEYIDRRNLKIAQHINDNKNSFSQVMNQIAVTPVNGYYSQSWETKLRISSLHQKGTHYHSTNEKVMECQKVNNSIKNASKPQTKDLSGHIVPMYGKLDAKEIYGRLAIATGLSTEQLKEKVVFLFPGNNTHTPDPNVKSSIEDKLKKAVIGSGLAEAAASIHNDGGMTLSLPTTFYAEESKDVFCQEQDNEKRREAHKNESLKLFNQAKNQGFIFVLPVRKKAVNSMPIFTKSNQDVEMSWLGGVEKKPDKIHTRHVKEYTDFINKGFSGKIYTGSLKKEQKNNVFSILDSSNQNNNNPSKNDQMFLKAIEYFKEKNFTSTLDGTDNNSLIIKKEEREVAILTKNSVSFQDTSDTEHMLNALLLTKFGKALKDIGFDDLKQVNLTVSDGVIANVENLILKNKLTKYITINGETLKDKDTSKTCNNFKKNYKKVTNDCSEENVESTLTNKK